MKYYITVGIGLVKELNLLDNTLKVQNMAGISEEVDGTIHVPMYIFYII